MLTLLRKAFKADNEKGFNTTLLKSLAGYQMTFSFFLFFFAANFIETRKERLLFNVHYDKKRTFGFIEILRQGSR